LIWEDVWLLAEAMGGDPNDVDLTDRICPQRFKAPMAPNIAARLEGRAVSDAALLNGLDAWESHADLVLVEGAGGLLSPASDEMLVADLAIKLNAPLLLVAANRLGAIHQTLATVEAAQTRGLKIVAVVLNQVTGDLDPILQKANEEELRRLLPGIPLLVVPHAGTLMNHSQQLDPVPWFQPDTKGT